MTTISYKQFSYDYHKDVLLDPAAAQRKLIEHPNHAQQLYQDYNLRAAPLKVVLKRAGGFLDHANPNERRVHAVFHHSVALFRKYISFFKREQLKHSQTTILYAHPKDLDETFVTDVAKRLCQLETTILETLTYPTYASLCVHSNSRLRALFGAIITMKNTSDALTTIQLTAKLLNQHEDIERKIDILQALQRTGEAERIFVIHYASLRKHLSKKFNLLLQMIEQLQLIHGYGIHGVDSVQLSHAYLDFIETSSADRRDCLKNYGGILLRHLARGASPELLKLIPEKYDAKKMRLIEMIALEASY